MVGRYFMFFRYQGWRRCWGRRKKTASRSEGSGSCTRAKLKSQGFSLSSLEGREGLLSKSRCFSKGRHCGAHDKVRLILRIRNFSRRLCDRTFYYPAKTLL